MNTTANTITGTGTIFDQQVLENDFIIVGSEEIQIKSIDSPTLITTKTIPQANTLDGGATQDLYSDVWDDRFLKRYGTTFIKYQWGSNLSKFGGVQM